MSNWHDPDEKSSVQRRERGVHGRAVRAAPKVARDYNLYMGGVDQLDSLRGSCTCAVKSQKWWHALFWWMLDTATVNAYRVYCFEAKGTPMDRATYILSVIDDLLGGESISAMSSMCHPRATRRVAGNARVSTRGHLVECLDRQHFPRSVGVRTVGTETASGSVQSTVARRVRLTCASTA